MGINLLKTYAVECASGAVAVITLAGALIADAGAAFGSAPLGTVAMAVCTLSSGILCGSILRRLTDSGPLAAAEARITELERRPTAEKFAATVAARDTAASKLDSAQAALAAISEELADALRVQEAMAAEAAQARQTASLDRFSDFQLLAMTDVCDAEDAHGSLLRPYGDPAMEQLQALGVVSFDTAQEQGSATARDLRWTLKAEWRQAVRAQRSAIDERTRALRDRRTALAEAGE